MTFFTPFKIFTSSLLLRLTLLLYGLHQDAHSPLKYTDIDYQVFTSASLYISRGQSPYARETYRYTPLLAFLLLPTTWGPLWFSFGKILFAVGDLVAGFLIVRILRNQGMSQERALRYASIWLLNPMVATISTRGSSEGLLGAMVVALLWAVLEKRIWLSGALLGLAVHFKIYPVVYGMSIIWWLDAQRLGQGVKNADTLMGKIKNFLNPARVQLTVVSLLTFMGLNITMYIVYGFPFLQHTYLHHVTRIDHRHNFSPYNILLYLSSSQDAKSGIRFESLAFVPQLFLSAIAIPFMLSKKDLPATMLAQTFAFVTFNKVCTSQVSVVSFPCLSQANITLVFPLVHYFPTFIPTQ
jgi:phosphatidylinositol glycan class M